MSDDVDAILEVEQSDTLGSTLAIRPGEWVTIWPDFRLNMEPLYAVALLETPPIPPEFTGHEESTEYAVVCAGWFYANHEDKQSWGWVHLEPDTKAYIGHMLVKMKAEIGEWYYLEITREKPFPAIPRVKHA
jgi:hypothetical protein